MRVNTSCPLLEECEGNERLDMETASNYLLTRLTCEVDRYRPNSNLQSLNRTMFRRKINRVSGKAVNMTSTRMVETRNAPCLLT